MCLHGTQQDRQSPAKAGRPCHVGLLVKEKGDHSHCCMFERVEQFGATCSFNKGARAEAFSSGVPKPLLCFFCCCYQQEEAGLEAFQPHFKAVIQHMPELQQVLQLQASPKVHQSSSSTPQPAVGSHRVWACGILHMLLLHNNPVIDRAVAEAGVLPVVLAMALQHGHCSAVQCRAVEMLRSSLRSSVQDLWQGLFTAGYGQQLQRPGSSDLLPPLHEALVQIGRCSGNRCVQRGQGGSCVGSLCLDWQWVSATVPMTTEAYSRSARYKGLQCAVPEQPLMQHQSCRNAPYVFGKGGQCADSKPGHAQSQQTHIPRV